jgi:hypothetical protein
MAQAELAACHRKGCAQAPQLSLLVGSLLLSRGEPREALAQLRRHPAPPLLEPYRSFAIGQAFFYARDFRAAAQAFSEATTAPGRVEPCNRKGGRGALARREPGQALPLLERALGRWAARSCSPPARRAGRRWATWQGPRRTSTP